MFIMTDNESPALCMSHGNIVSRLPHVRFSFRILSCRSALHLGCTNTLPEGRLWWPTCSVAYLCWLVQSVSDNPSQPLLPRRCPQPTCHAPRCSSSLLRTRCFRPQEGSPALFSTTCHVGGDNGRHSRILTLCCVQTAHSSPHPIAQWSWPDPSIHQGDPRWLDYNGHW